jgi:phage terminase small subunit
MQMTAVKNFTPKQARFIQEYLVDGNGSAAAVRAGYSPHSAKAIACELLTKPDLQAAVREKQAELSASLEITREGVIRGFLEAFEMAKTDRNPAVMVSAASSIAKLLGLYAAETKRIEVSAEGQGAIRRVEAMSDAELAQLIAAGQGA